MTPTRVLSARLPGAICIAACLIAGTARAEPEIGSVFQRDYLGATGTRAAGGSPEKLYFNTTVYAAETVATGAGESTALRFHDGSKLQIGASSTVLLDRFVYDPDAGAADAALSFSTGIFRFISGELRDDAFRLETPSATLAIRGTRFILAVDAAGNSNVWVIEGAVEGVARAGGAPGTARAGQTLEVTSGVPGVRILDTRSGPRDPAVEADLSLLPRPGLDGRDGAPGQSSPNNGGGARRGGASPNGN